MALRNRLTRKTVAPRYRGRDAFNRTANSATARVQPAEPAFTLCGKQATVKPWSGSCSRLHSFSMWQ